MSEQPLTYIDASGNPQKVKPATPLPVQIYQQSGPVAEWETIAASQTDQIMGATGAVGDFLAGVLIVPATTGAGTVAIKDGNGSAVTIFTGGGTLVDLKPFYVPLGLTALAATTPGWKITTGANVSAIGIGNFT